jgi:DNA-binding CsgD family transcriptional regulator/endogenous inhibitor of DNA gyrase (YacG/DUF329 family)
VWTFLLSVDLNSAAFFANRLEVTIMTQAQKESIRTLRSEGQGYSMIANTLGISVNTVKSYCRRKNLSRAQEQIPGNEIETRALSFCQNCGKPLPAAEKVKPRRFCSDVCRMSWWNSHQDSVRKKAVYILTCAYCGASFESYGNKGRKYCSHSCYIKDRFGEEQAS